MADKKWAQGAVKHPGALTAIAKSAGAWDEKTGTINASWLRKQATKPGRIGKMARLALTFRKMG